MDPYLEEESLWTEFHAQFVKVLFQILLPSLVDRYRAGVVQRRYELTGLRGTGERREDYIEIRERQDGRLVTVMDVVSPANKTTAEGRQAYLDQRRKGREANVNLVEIDLVLQGPPTLEYSRDGLPEWDYAVTITRSTAPERYEIYTATLQKRLPRFRLPLAAGDRDAVLGLHTAFLRCYQQEKFFERIDYCRDPAVTLDEEDLSWLDQLLQSQGLRKPLPPHEEIALAAYAMWEEEGRLHGRDREHWFRAMARLRRVGP
jgi:hypothetical protein